MAATAWAAGLSGGARLCKPGLALAFSQRGIVNGLTCHAAVRHHRAMKTAIFTAPQPPPRHCHCHCHCHCPEGARRLAPGGYPACARGAGLGVVMSGGGGVRVLAAKSAKSAKSAKFYGVGWVGRVPRRAARGRRNRGRFGVAGGCRIIRSAPLQSAMATRSASLQSGESFGVRMKAAGIRARKRGQGHGQTTRSSRSRPTSARQFTSRLGGSGLGIGTGTHCRCPTTRNDAIHPV